MEFGILGPLRAVADGRDVDIGGPRQRRILAALLLSPNRPVDMARLADVAWAGDPPATARRQVQNSVAVLRSALTRAGAVIETRGDGYLLRVGPDDVDALVFDRLVARGRAEGDTGLLRQALGLWRGPALAGLGGAVLERAAAGLDERRLSVQEECIDLELAAGAHERVLPELRRLVFEHPSRERFVGQLMTAAQRCGRRAEALDAYRELAALLAEHLGIDPSPDLRRLHEAMQAEIPSQLPSDVPRFTGRTGDLDWLDRALCAGTTVAAVTGTAGVGKTALALRWAHRVRDRFPDGQLYVNLRGYAQAPPLRPIDALAGFLRAFGVAAERVPTDVDEAIALLRGVLDGRRVLVVLDNAAGAEQVRPLLPAGSGSLALVTSRDALAGLAARGAVRRTLDVLTRAEAHDLLTGLLGAGRVGAEPVAVAELASLCAYLPLAVRIAAANLPDRESLGAYTSRLRAGNRLAALQVEGDREAAVRVAFELSYTGLPARARRLFRLLGLVPGSDVTAEAAAALAGGSVAEVRPLLERLDAAHLIDEHAPGRYGFHDLLRLYAAELAGTETEAEPATARLYGWYLRAATVADAMLYPGTLHLPDRPSTVDGPVPCFEDHASALAWLDTERPNLVAAVTHASAHGPRPMAWLLCDALRRYLYVRGYLVDLLTVGRAGLAAATAEGARAAQAICHLCIGNHYQYRNRYADAVEHLSWLRDTGREIDWAEAQTSAQGQLGAVYAMMGRPRQAVEQLTEALAVNRRLGVTIGMSNDHALLGMVHRELGELERAHEYLTEALRLYREIGSRVGEAGTLDTLGQTYHNMGRFDEAFETLTRALELMRETGVPDGEADVLRLLGALHRDRGRYEQAVECAEASLAVARRIGSRRYSADALNVLASVHDRLGCHRAAIDARREALRLAESSGDRYPALEAMVGLAGALCHDGRLDEALEIADTALAYTVDAEYRLLTEDAQAILAEIHLARQDAKIQSR
jgi:DNA-binding SARP family transcriptional activator/Tfp pilus assembly protein PilF